MHAIKITRGVLPVWPRGWCFRVQSELFCFVVCLRSSSSLFHSIHQLSDSRIDTHVCMWPLTPHRPCSAALLGQPPWSVPRVPPAARAPSTSQASVPSSTRGRSPPTTWRSSTTIRRRCVWHACISSTTKNVCLLYVCFDCRPHPHPSRMFQVVLGRTMAEWCRFSVCYWHTFRGVGADPFGGQTLFRPWDDGSNVCRVMSCG